MANSRAQPGKWRAAVLAVAVHVLFIGLLMFGVTWQNKEPPAMQVELWDKLPTPTPTPTTPPQEVPALAPPPQPEVKQKKVTPPEPDTTEIEKPDPDIALKKAQKKKAKEDEEKQRLAKLELKRAEQEQKRAEQDQKRVEQEKVLEEKRQRDIEARQKQEEARAKAKELNQQKEANRLLDKRLEQLSRQEAAREAQEKAELTQVREAQLAAQAQREGQLAAASNSLVNDYKSRIRSKIRRFIVLPGEMRGNPQAEFDVTLMPSGDVLRVALARSSGIPAYDTAVERAIYKAQPLPLPPQTELFGQFRELRLKFRPNDEY